MLEWEWYQDDRCVRLLLHLILKANYKAVRWKGHDMKAGELITSPASLADQLNWSRSATIRTLEKLKSCGEVNTKANNKWTLVTLVKWEKYQLDTSKSNIKPDSKRTSNDTTSGHQTIQQADTDKEGKEVKERKEGKESEGDTNVSPRKAPDARITSLIEHMRSVNGGVMDGTVQRNRQACHTMLQRMEKEYPDRDAAETVRHLIDIAKLDAFHGPNVTSFDYLVRNSVKIINAFKTKRNGTAGQTREQINESIDRVVAERFSG